MRLVQFDVIRELWRSYEIDPYEATGVDHKSGNATLVMREPKVWRYSYELWSNGRREVFNGIAAIAHTVPAGRSLIHRFLREEAWKDVA